MQELLAVIDPIAFELGPISVAWYGVIIALAMLLAVFLSSREAKKLGMDSDIVIDVAFWIIPFGIIGARIYYVLFELDSYIQDPIRILFIWEGGLAIYGGIIAGFFTILWFAHKENLDIWLLFDLVAPSLLIAQSIGRWGNFVNQEAFGGEVSREFLESLYLPEFIIEGVNINGAYHHPTFLYESILTLTGFIIALVLRRKGNLLRGELISFYLIWYGTGRFFIEGMRTDSLYIGPLRVSQVLSALIVLLGIGIILYRRFYLYPRPPYYSEGVKPELTLSRKKQPTTNRGWFVWLTKLNQKK